MNTILAILFIAFSLLTGSSRGEFIEGVMSVYEDREGEVSVTNCDITDSDEYVAVCKAHEVGIVVGTSDTTFDPNSKLLPYQAFLIVGRTLQLLDK